MIVTVTERQVPGRTVLRTPDELIRRALAR
jgi:hypothetical protein